MKSTIPIVYHGGSYGTFLEWALYSLTNEVEIENPLTQRTNCHGFDGHHLLDINGWRQYLNSEDDWSFVRFHPKTQKDHNLSSNLGEVACNSNRFIYIYFSHNSLLLGLANQFEKTVKDWWAFNFKYHINRDDLFKAWNIDPNTADVDIPRWVKREFLSFYMIDMWYDQIAWHDQSHWQQYPNCHMILVDQLLTNFVETINNVRDAFNLSFVRPVTDLLPVHRELILMQHNINIGEVCNNIVSNTINGTEYQWLPLSIVGESWVQWQLRNLGYEIRCDGLDIFPTTTVQLQNLLYKA